MFKTKVEIYTDGACSPNPGVGGWGAILISSKHKIRTEISYPVPKSIFLGDSRCDHHFAVALQKTAVFDEKLYFWSLTN